MWFRFDCLACDTGWTGDLPGDQFACWIKLIGMVKIQDPRGGTISTAKFTESTIARKNLCWDSWLKMLGAAELHDAIEVADGRLKFRNWSRYQGDASHADRQRRYRSKRESDSEAPQPSQPSQDADETLRDGTGQYITDTPPNPPLGGKASKGPFFGQSLPEHLDTPEFRELWGEWARERKAMKKPLTPGAVKRQLTALGALTPAEAKATVEKSIQNTWQGLFPDKAKGTYHGRQDSGGPPAREWKRPETIGEADPGGTGGAGEGVGSQGAS